MLLILSCLLLTCLRTSNPGCIGTQFLGLAKVKKSIVNAFDPDFESPFLIPVLIQVDIRGDSSPRISKIAAYITVDATAFLVYIMINDAASLPSPLSSSLK